MRVHPRRTIQHRGSLRTRSFSCGLCKLGSQFSGTISRDNSFYLTPGNVSPVICRSCLECSLESSELLLWRFSLYRCEFDRFEGSRGLSALRSFWSANPRTCDTWLSPNPFCCISLRAALARSVESSQLP